VQELIFFFKNSIRNCKHMERSHLCSLANTNKYSHKDNYSQDMTKKGKKDGKKLFIACLLKALMGCKCHLNMWNGLEMTRNQDFSSSPF
jgi:hypothetical protein